MKQRWEWIESVCLFVWFCHTILYDLLTMFLMCSVHATNICRLCMCVCKMVLKNWVISTMCVGNEHPCEPFQPALHLTLVFLLLNLQSTPFPRRSLSLILL